MLKYLAVAAAAMFALWPLSVAGAPTWEQWQSVGGIFDLGGPRSDGSLVVAGSAALYTLTPDGALAPFATGYRDDAGAEAYVAVSPGLRTSGCAFARDDTFILRLHAPRGITRVRADGTEVGSFADLLIPSLNGITFDTGGAFSHDLLVTAPVNGKIEVVGIDCAGTVHVITTAAPAVEGGIAVAPQSFGTFGGDLIAADELSGVIWAIRPDGAASRVVDSGLAHGQDTGVESVAFVPTGFTKGGYVYYADRKTSNNPHPGSDHVLRLSSADLSAAGVEDGDLLAATEGGASMIDVRCGISCRVMTVLPLPTEAHGEGHLVFTLTPQVPSPVASAVQVAYAPSRGGFPLGAFLALTAVALGAGAVAFALLARRR